MIRERFWRFFGFCFPFIYLIAANECFCPADQFIIGKRFGKIVIASAGKTKGFITVFCTCTINVVTTATDIKNVVAPDIIAKENNFIIDDLKIAKNFAVKLLDEEVIGFLDEFKCINTPKGYNEFNDNLNNVLWITNKIQRGDLKGKNVLKLIKRNIAVS